ncbi:MAG: bifunctional riboflavin kinase/FAD synthetase [Ignavibacterium sp.]|nr:MAG: bifunctional riboflavin kinase/FAD synthetase [Ignavibacterium sp.]
MRIYQDLSEVTHDDNTIITLGTFDGVHVGHRFIIEEVVKKASDLGGRSFLITYHPHPRKVISGQIQITLLSTPSEKIELFESLGIENLLIVNFTKKFSQLTPEKFIDKFVVKGIGAKEIVIGYDHHFGKGRGGNQDFLKSMGNSSGFDVTIIPEFKMDDVTVSSSKIRNALLEGDIAKANEYLGRQYAFNGTVVEGDKRGRELGYPTANLKIDDEDKLLPALGIYAVEVTLKNSKKYGLLSVGKRPTFYESGDIVPEVYLFDFNEDIYGEEIAVSLVERIRGEEKFSSAEELIEQMNKDKEIGLEILSKLTN